MAAPVPEAFEHAGPWTEAEFLALPVDRRVELLDEARKDPDPDLVVTTVPGLDVTVYQAADVALVVEIVSSSNAVVDRVMMPQLYAQAGIPHYLRIE